MSRLQTTVADRDENGNFLPGNQVALGHRNPQAARAAALKKAALDAVTPEDMREVMGAMVREAKDGNVFAASLVLDRTIGKVRPAEPEAADNLRQTLSELWRDMADDGTSEVEFRVLPARTEENGPQEPVEENA